YWSARLEGQYRHLTDYTLLERQLPYNRLPRAYFSWEQPFGTSLLAGTDVEAVHFSHIQASARPGGSRLFVKPWVSLPLEGASWYVRPTLAFRHVQYRLDDALAASLTPSGATPDESPSANHAIGSLDAGLFFDRNT